MLLVLGKADSLKVIERLGGVLLGCALSVLNVFCPLRCYYAQVTFCVEDVLVDALCTCRAVTSLF